MRGGRALLAALLLGVVAAGCGGGEDGFPALASTEACAAPRLVAGDQPLLAFRSLVHSETQRIEDLTNAFRLRYPNGTFYRRPEFRTDFAPYVNEAICIAAGLRKLEQPGLDYLPEDSNLNAMIEEFIQHTLMGREAVRTRNVSDYRAWNRGVEAKLEQVRAAATILTVPR